MLPKSQARAFFIGFTVLFSGVFLGLTVDTIRQVPARSHEDKLTAEVVAGKALWEANNCMGCHTLLGEGAYYAPELTKVVERRGAPWIKVFLGDPAAMFPGRRQMVKYDFTEEEKDQLIAFFTWVGEIDTNGFPKKPDLTISGVGVGVGVGVAAAAVPPAGSGLAVAGGAPEGMSARAAPPAFFTQVCQSCHAVGGVGGVVGPSLDGVATRFSPEKLDAWLRDPASVKPGTAMPNLALPDATRAELVTWLMTLR